MTRSSSVLFCLILSCFKVFGQNKYTVYFDAYAKDHAFENSRMVVPVFKMQNQQMESYEQFGIESSKKTIIHKVKLPDLSNTMDTGFAYIYSGINPNNNYYPVLIANYGRRMKPAVIYVDQNQNFDFTDDGSPITYQLRDSYVDIAIAHPTEINWQTIVRLSRFDFRKDLSFKKLTDEFYKRYQGERIFVGTDYSFREQRFQIKFNRIVAEGDSFQIALVDKNFNGLFNEPEIDQIRLEAYQADFFSKDFVFEVLKKDTYFERNLKRYQVTHIDSFGRSISFVSNQSAALSRSLSLNKKVPKFKFTDAQGKTYKINRFRRKPMYIYFWSRDIPNFELDTAYLRKIESEFAKNIKIIALNYGDNPKRLSGFVEFNNVFWLNGLANKKIIQQYHVEQFPSSFLTKKRRRLQAVNISPKELYDMLKTKP